jgi:competence protein ComGA
VLIRRKEVAMEHLFHQIIEEAIKKSASDVHFLPEQEGTVVYFRINGKRFAQFSLTKEEYGPLLSYFKYTAGMDIGETRKPQNGKLSFTYRQDIIDLRLSTLPVENSESLAIRILPRYIVPHLEQLFLFPAQVHTLFKWINQPFGMILFTGPTGSGKTTTMYSLLQWVIKNNLYQAITLEDPIEKELDSILQVQVNEKAGMSYDAGLKAALRHDPDIIMVGEIRDRATAHFAFQAAFTGHLVITTLHAKNAHGTIYRLLEMGISKTNLQQSLIGIASQRLITTRSPKGKLKRSAILELLDDEILLSAINGKNPYQNPQFQSFEKLRRKAHALGYQEQSTWAEKDLTHF